MNLSIIIPIYNVEQYVRACLESVFKQGLDENTFEVILINDGTKDKSFEIIKDIVNQHNNIIVIEQTNQGLSAARNTGLSKAKGDYILFVDSDDLLIENSLGNLLDDVRMNQSDMLIAGFYKMNDEEIMQGHIQKHPTYNSTPKNEKQTTIELLDTLGNYVWRALYKRTFLIDNGIKFLSGIYFEDIPFTSECCLKAKTCIFTDYPFYIYRQRRESIVHTINKKKVMDFSHVIARLWELKNMDILPIEKKKIEKIIFTTFSLQIWYLSHNKELLNDRKEILNDLHQKIPNLHFKGGIKERLVSFFYKIMPNTYILFRSLT